MKNIQPTDSPKTRSNDMFLIEKIYELKKRFFEWYKKYFTIEGTYTSLLPDKIYLKKLYKVRTGKKLNLKNPQTFNEKQNWLKLYDRRPEYTVMVDKYKAREYIAEKIGEQYLVPLLGVWDSPYEIDFDALPNEFVLKCNHDNGVIICRDKSKLDIEKTKKELAYRLNRDYYKKLREWPYKDVPRKIICEKFMKNTNGEKCIEYKLMCFSGKVEYILVVADRTSNKVTTIDTYNSNWTHTDLINGKTAIAGNVFDKPVCFDEIRGIAQKLSQNIPFLRVDFNIWNNKVYFGELTISDSGGFEKYKPEKWDYILGDKIELPNKHRR